MGTYLNIFVRNCDWVRMANLAQLVNAIAPIVTSPETAAATVSRADGNAHSVSPDKIAITLVNRGSAAEVQLRDRDFDGPATVRTLPDVEAARREEGSENTRDGVVAVRLPPRSFTVIEAAMA